jgi:hypothetical protein
MRLPYKWDCVGRLRRLPNLEWRQAMRLPYKWDCVGRLRRLPNLEWRQAMRLPYNADCVGRLRRLPNLEWRQAMRLPYNADCVGRPRRLPNLEWRQAVRLPYNWCLCRATAPVAESNRFLGGLKGELSRSPHGTVRKTRKPSALLLDNNRSSPVSVHYRYMR